MAISICLSIITLNVKGQNAPIKRHRVSNLIKNKQTMTYNMLPTRNSLQVEIQTHSESREMEKDI